MGVPIFLDNWRKAGNESVYDEVGLEWSALAKGGCVWCVWEQRVSVDILVRGDEVVGLGLACGMSFAFCRCNKYLQTYDSRSG